MRTGAIGLWVRNFAKAPQGRTENNDKSHSVELSGTAALPYQSTASGAPNTAQSSTPDNLQSDNEP